MATQTPARSTARTRAAARNPLFSALIGLATLAILLQGLWAGIFLEGEKRSETWVEVHSHGGEVAIALALLATVVALVKLRHRRDLVAGSAALTVLLLAEAYIGGLITDDKKDTLTAVHVPLAMAIMALAVWVPMRSLRTRTDEG